MLIRHSEPTLVAVSGDVKTPQRGLELFDFIETRLAPGERHEDRHHLGAQVWNPSDVDVPIKLQLEDVSLELTLPPNGLVTASEEQSAHSLIVENAGNREVQVVWKKTRD